MATPGAHAERDAGRFQRAAQLAEWVVGAGMYGIAAAAALVMKGIRAVVLDRAPEGQEGPWVTYARMETLRSPKHLPGVALGIPSLTYRAWHEARFGAAAWDALKKIPNAPWQDYLTWVRTVLRLPLRSGVAVGRIKPSAGLVAVSTVEAGVARTLHARRVALASGRAGMGFAVPDWVDRSLWPDRAAHMAEFIDFDALRGRAVAVVGAGPSAWDAVCLGQRRHGPGARRVPGGHARAPAGAAAGQQGPRVRDARLLRGLGRPAGRGEAHPRLPARPASGAARDGAAHGAPCRVPHPLRRGAARRGAVRSGAGGRRRRHRHLGRPLHAPAGLQHPGLGRFPWLGDRFGLTERTPGACPGLSAGAERLAHAIAARLLTEDIAPVRQALKAFAEPELEDTPFSVPGRFSSA